MDDKRALEDGKLVLFRRNGIWQARIALGAGRYLWRSVRTSDEAKAVTLGRKLFYQTEAKLTEGLPVHNRTLNAVIDEFVAVRERDNAQGKSAKRASSIRHTSDAMLRQIKRVVRFWREYAGAKPIEAVDDRLLKAYIGWRKAYYHGRADLPRNAKPDPTDKTLQWEMMLGKMLVRFAHDQGYRGNKPLPTVTFSPKRNRVRPAFTLNEFRAMQEGLKAHMLAAKNEREQVSRQLLRDYVMVLGLSGMRVGEANDLRVRDVEMITDSDGRPNVQFHIRGKTGARVVVPHIDARRIVEELFARQGERKADDYLFAMPGGTRIITLADQFNAFLSKAGLTMNSAGEKYTLYSLRHFYAVRAIHRDIDVYTIARNMGTSVQMIEQYYGKGATPQSRARKLGGESGLYQRQRGETVPELTPEQRAARAAKERARRAARRMSRQGQQA